MDRPKLLFSSSVMVNSQVVMNQAGQSGFAGGEAAALGQMGGSIAFNTVLGREQTYYFKEPGYIFDMLTIRPDRKSTRLNSSHITRSRMPSSA